VNDALSAEVGLGRGDPDGVGEGGFAATGIATIVVPSTPRVEDTSSVVPTIRRASPADRTSVDGSGAPLADSVALAVGVAVADRFGVGVAVGDARRDGDVVGEDDARLTPLSDERKPPESTRATPAPVNTARPIISA